MKIPRYHELFDATLQALHDLGGSASITELLEQVIENEKYPLEVVEPLHLDKPGKTELSYQLDWSRTYLKKYGLIDNSSRGIWNLTEAGLHVTTVNSGEVVKTVRKSSRRKRNTRELIEDLHETATPDDSAAWQNTLLELLLEIKPDAFERLCQRVLRESGFIQVEVTGRTGDGGIDGNGVIQLAGLLSFPVVFQCKRYRDSVSAGTVRDFRGAMVGRADKGLIITTGNFTSGARAEATRDGAPPIDLVDGEKLLERLKELNIGVRTRQVELVEVDEKWFENI